MTMHNLRLLKQTTSSRNTTHPAERTDKGFGPEEDTIFRLVPPQVEQFNYLATVPINEQRGKRTVGKKQNNNNANPASKKSILLWYGFLAAIILFITYRFLIIAAIHH